MSQKEKSYAKQTLLSVKDWDAYQKLLRTWSKLFEQNAREGGLPASLKPDAVKICS